MSITTILCILIAVVSIGAFNKPEWIERLKHWPYAVHHRKEYYRWITSGFVHGGWLHLLINLFVFWQFGEQVEHVYKVMLGDLPGQIAYILLFTLGVIVSDLPSYVQHKNNPHFASIGASGAVSAVLFAYILFFPWHMLYLYGIIPIPGIVAGIGYLWYESYMSKKEGTGINHNAHLFGALFGVVFTIALRPSTAIDFFQALISFGN
jgi:membrane associated rhomboid family serine protease